MGLVSGCPACGADVPDGEFCPACGARRSATRAGGRLRLDAYAAAPRERVLRPWVTTSLFPQLPPRSRSAFRAGLIIVALAAVGFALLRWTVPVIATAVFGLPVLFAVYLRQIHVGRSIPVRHIALASVVAVGLGAGWALIAGPIVADAYNASLGGQMDLGQLLLCGVAIPMTFALVLIAPAALVRAVDRSSRESLNGFTIGAVGATIVNAAATATLQAPRLALGVTADSQPASGLLADALVEGVAWPLGSVAVGGIFGIALWFTPRPDVPRRYRRSVVVPAALLGALLFTVAMGVVDVAPIPLGVYLALQLLIALVAVLAVRVVIADALLHEETDETGDEHLQCAECGHRVASMPFCSDCGVAIRASSRAVGESNSEPRRTATYRNVVGPVIVGVGAAVAAVAVVTSLIKPAPATYVCPPDCGRPPLGDPVETNPRFSGDGGAFSVAYPGEGSAYEVTLDPPGANGVQARYTGGDTGILTLFGEPARDRTAEQIAQEILSSKYPGAIVDHEIPNASVGYQPGYGVVADVYPRDTSSSYTRLRVIIMAAVKHDYALIATASGPYHEFSPEYGSGHPSAADLEVAMDMGKYVNSFKWNGDRHRRTP